MSDLITTPGVYDLPADEYHADPVEGGSLSSTGARMLLPPSCPALFRWAQDNPRPPSSAFEVGTAAHKLVLGVGPDLVRINAEEWRTKAIKEEVAAVRAAGGVPLRPAEYQQVHDMAAALRRHPIAAALLRPGSGRAEQALFWVDQETGVWCRALVDWLPHSTNGRMIVPDYKTARSAAPAAVARSIADYGYHQQAPWYLDGIHALGLADDAAAFVFIVQEKEPPYLVNVVQPDADAMRIGRERNRAALEIYRDCTESGIWPGYTTDVIEISLPYWVQRQHEESYVD